MASGGERAGRIGNLHPNRSDMRQPVAAPKGGDYGDRKQLEQSQSVVALPNNAASPPARVPADDTRGMIPSMSDPSSRPNEPVTAGLPIGPGAGPEALTGQPAQNQELQILRAIFTRYPNEDLRRLIEFTENNL